ncbi:DUF493 domain-containing protein [Sulfuriferula sp. AH1]|uniref:DUF493 family protein n=1 Tax=Sulfuriferula sp. AH1 TaxID=1985873 RepID=UPI000B3B355F|nr:DUF493 family protein [Sulfuriferula sp. AH1]ARU32411.1 DUF493 domain-containing protein [Sulfuriferula sp. AH1]
MNEIKPEDSLIEYPSDFPIKIMGAAHPAFEQTIVELVLQHAPDFDTGTVECRPSKAGNYLSITCTIRATSREQLDNLYRALTAHEMVKVVL